MRVPTVAFGTFGLALVAAAIPASAYEIETSILGLKPIHEEMTRAAVSCADKVAGSPTEPANCWGFANWSRPGAGQRSDLERATRWPDDPTRQGIGTSYPKQGVTLAISCAPFVGPEKGIDTSGLLCSSHYGRMQFMHAMKGPLDKDGGDTRALILDWAKFAYQVASGAIDPDASLCTATADRGRLTAAFIFNDPGKCQRRPRLGGLFGGLFGYYPAYTVRSLFTQRCSNPFVSSRCWEQLPNENGAAMARLHATGALLHLIQDSYSQAHTARSTGDPVGERGPFSAKVVCRHPTEFFNYKKQTRDIHSPADQIPVLDPSCARGANGTDDPVTASAVTIAMLRRGASADDYVKYLRRHVIG